MDKQKVSSASPLEDQIGFSRAVRVGPHVFVAGTAPIGRDGAMASAPDVYLQTKRCFEIVAGALAKAGAGMGDVVRTRMMMTDVTQWREAARAHGEVFRVAKPAATFVEVSRFIDPSWLIEVEVDAVIAS
jgi:enamine deaminase RidA (YjgF/YER057c/UK114 family)